MTGLGIAQAPASNVNKVQDVRLDPVLAGNLYFTNVGNNVSEDDLESIALGVENNFREHAGIHFGEVRVLRAGEYPTLQDNDILLYAIDKDIAQENDLNRSWDSKDSNGGKFGVGIKEVDERGAWLSFEKYEKFRLLSGMPYDPYTAANSIGFIITEPSDELECLADKKPLLQQKIQEKSLIRLATHEVGHGFSGTHIYRGAEIGELADFFMEYGNCVDPVHFITEPRFHQDNVGRMRDYLEGIKGSDTPAIDSIQAKAIIYLDRIQVE